MNEDPNYDKNGKKKENTSRAMQRANESAMKARLRKAERVRLGLSCRDQKRHRKPLKHLR